MTDSEIINALECCQGDYIRNCKECPYEHYKRHYITTTSCESNLRKDLLDFINRHKEEVERLHSEVNKQLVKKYYKVSVDQFAEYCNNRVKKKCR